jgi:predicted dehydrogenase
VENRPAWFYDREQAGGGIVHDMMAHFFDLLADLIGPIADVRCITGTYFPERVDEHGQVFRSDVDDAAAVLLLFENGAIGDLFASWVRRRHEEVPFFEIDGEQASLLVSFHQLKIQRAEKTPLFRYDPVASQTDPMVGWTDIPLLSVDPFELQLGRFLAGVLMGKPVHPDWSDAVRTQQLIERAYASAQ